MEPAQNMPKGKRKPQSIYQSISLGVSASITLTASHGIAIDVLLFARLHWQNGQLSSAKFMGGSFKRAGGGEEE